MPPGKRPPHHHHRHSLSAIAEASDPERLSQALVPVIPDARDRAFVVRCILEEGPVHHRASSWALLMLASEIARRLEGAPEQSPPPDDDSVTVRLRLPPHLGSEEDTAFPIRLPIGPLRAIAAGERQTEALADALVDGPPHHALANAALITIFQRILARLAPEPAGG